MTSSRGTELAALIPLLVIPLLISCGQLLFKYASHTPGYLRSSNLASLVTNPFLLVALLVYFLSTLWWVIVLRTTTLSSAYAFMALSFLYVPALSWIVLGERFGWRSGLAFVLILAGIVLAASDRASAPPSEPAASEAG